MIYHIHSLFDLPHKQWRVCVCVCVGLCVQSEPASLPAEDISTNSNGPRQDSLFDDDPEDLFAGKHTHAHTHTYTFIYLTKWSKNIT